MRVDDDTGVARLLAMADQKDALQEVRDLAELEHRLFGRAIEPVRLSRYVLLERLATGGFGAVYLAFDPELDRKVAIKLLHGRGADETSRAEARERLLAEAQAMAKFSHPNVAAVHDVGTFDAGVTSALRILGPEGGDVGPGTFIVMELVQGVTLRRWLAAEERSPRQIVDAFVQAGEGLAAAHDAGLVHGDFKPDNVLVGDDGRVRILDFGLARALPSAEATARASTIAGTPAYMAPEQLEGRAGDARSDQYAFALALREALYGIDPTDRTSTERPAAWKGDAGPQPKAARYIRVAIARALASDPDARHLGMPALLDALTRRRRRRTERWLAAAGVVALVTGGAAWIVSRDVEATCNPSGELAGVWDDATRERLADRFASSGAPDAAKIWASVADKLDAHAAEWTRVWVEVCRATTAGDDRSAALADRLFCLERDVQRIGGLTRVFAEADAMIVLRANEAVLDLPRPERCRTAGPRAPVELGEASRAEALAVEAEIVRARELGRAGRLEESVVVARTAVDRAWATGASATLASALLALGTAERLAGRYAASTDALREALASAERAAAADLVVETLGGLLRSLSEQGEEDTADGVLIAALARIDRGDVSDAAIAELRYQAGVLRLAQERPEDAIVFLEQGLATSNEIYGGEHPNSASFHNVLGNALKDAGRLDEAWTHLDTALRIFTAELGASHPNVALVLNNLGNVRMRQGDGEAALELYLRAREVGLVAFPAGHPQTALFHSNVGDALTGAARFAEALASYDRAAAVRDAGGQARDSLARDLSSAGYLRIILGDYDAAVVDLQRSYELRLERLGPRHFETLRSRDGLAEALGEAGDLERARAIHEEVLQARLLLDDNEGELSTSYSTLGRVLVRLGRAQEGYELHARAVAIRDAAPDTDESTASWARAELGRSLLALRRHEEARDALTAALAVQERLWPDQAPQLRLLHDLAAASLALDDRERADALVERGLAIIDGTDGLRPIAAAETWALAADLRDDRRLACRAQAALVDARGRETLRDRVDAWLLVHGGSDCAKEGS